MVRESGAGELPEVRRAVLVGTRISPVQPDTKDDGTTVHTLWGELAWQLGGPESFALVAESDRRGTNPGDKLQQVFDRAGPCLILIDEWVAYARELYHDDSLPAGTFDTHLTFAQMLTEAAKASPETLPRRLHPRLGRGQRRTRGREALRRLRSVIGRLESSWRPATAEESFEIVRRRLFQAPDARALADRDATARVLGDFYRAQANEFPVECREAAYIDRIKHAYPIHPELFARLYEDWSTLDRFQRTRGVLRLMATVVHALWAGGDQSPIILPASVPLAQSEVAQELTRNLEDNWKPIMDADIDGPSSLPASIDAQYKNFGQYGAARRVARTVFLGSAPLVGSPNQGLDAARVRLGCVLPGEAVAVYGDALGRLADRATYFYSGAGRYWYGIQPGVTRLARDRAERLHTGDQHEALAAVSSVLEDMASRRRNDPHFAGVHVAPAGPAAVRDEPAVRLVVLGPDTAHRARAETSAALQLAGAILDERGSGPRDHRNMLVFLVADERRVDDLLAGVADELAWKSILDESEQLGLSPAQHHQASIRWDDSKRTVAARMIEAYQWGLVPVLTEPTGSRISWVEVKLDGSGDPIERMASKLVDGGHLYLKYPPLLLRLKLDGPLAPLWTDGSVSVGQVWDAYSRYLYLHRLRDIRVLFDCVAAGSTSTAWESEGFGVAEAEDPRAPGRLAGLIEPGSFALSVRGTTLVVEPSVALNQFTLDTAADQGRAVDQPVEGRVDVGGAAGVESAVILRRFFGSAALDPGRLGPSAARLAEEILSHLNALDGTEMEVVLEINAVNPDGFPEDVRKIVAENAAALRMRNYGFESE